MVSPKFEMASQFGASQPKEYSAGQTQCKNYWEKAEDGTTKYGWRLPTEAEITYIDNLQHNSNNLQGIVMTGKWYWDAYSTNGAYQMQGGSGGNASSAYVRCIRDIKD
ncbi:Major fimbrium tip subunit FimD [bioreactor metagenome]|uniref:Major fimbrium tip subunit FimD n=1 Tax=bioreactor metagenome TaxID=1076179 RepID=A0A645JA05_9ZZZZ